MLYSGSCIYAGMTVMTDGGMVGMLMCEVVLIVIKVIVAEKCA